jgi:hypothetical protein
MFTGSCLYGGMEKVKGTIVKRVRIFQIAVASLIENMITFGAIKKCL